MPTISASSRARAVLLLLRGEDSDVQFEIMRGAIRGATEQAARIAEQHNDGDEFETVTRLIAQDIRETAN